MSRPDPSATRATRNRYQRLAPLYDLMETFPERRYRSWRQRMWSQVEGPKILEVGVGTGKNFPYYPPNTQVSAIDLTPGMLERAKKQAKALNLKVDLRLGDAQALPFPNTSFDNVVATFVFCSVPDPKLGLRELGRVLKRGGKILLLEHVRSRLFLLGPLMDLLNPLFVRTMGPNINRRTVENVRMAGLVIDKVDDLDRGDIFKLIHARRYV